MFIASQVPDAERLQPRRATNQARMMNGDSPTTPDQDATRVDAAACVAFRVCNPVGVRETRLSRLDGQPA
jgi:hypothetical protein